MEIYIINIYIFIERHDDCIINTCMEWRERGRERGGGESERERDEVGHIKYEDNDNGI